MTKNTRAISLNFSDFLLIYLFIYFIYIMIKKLFKKKINPNKIINLKSIKSELIEIGGSYNSLNNDFQKILIIMPGNPGVSDLYKNFAEKLYKKLNSDKVLISIYKF
jgi:Ca2+/Na+ antiporter